MPERAAIIFTRKFGEHAGPLLERARPPTPRVEGGTVHLLDLHLINFRHDPKADDRVEKMLAGVRELADAAIEEHGGNLAYELKQRSVGRVAPNYDLIFKKAASVKN